MPIRCTCYQSKLTTNININKHELWDTFILVEICTVYPKKYAHGFVVLCFVVVMQSFIMNLHEVFIHIHQGCFAGTGAIVRLPQCQWRKPDGYGKISQCITTTKHSKAKTVCIFIGIYCINNPAHYTPGYVLFLIVVSAEYKPGSELEAALIENPGGFLICQLLSA